MPNKGSAGLDREGYSAVRSRSAVTFDLDARFPDRVFKERARDALFCEFDAVLTPELWPALCAMTRWHGDDHIDLLVLEPDGEALGSIAISANVVALTGASGKWGCWGERDPEVAVFQGFPDVAARGDWCARFGPFWDVSGAVESYLSMVFGGRPVSDDYAAALSANYGPSNRGRS